MADVNSIESLGSGEFHDTRHSTESARLDETDIGQNQPDADASEPETQIEAEAEAEPEDKEVKGDEADADGEVEDEPATATDAATEAEPQQEPEPETLEQEHVLAVPTEEPAEAEDPEPPADSAATEPETIQEPVTENAPETVPESGADTVPDTESTSTDPTLADPVVANPPVATEMPLPSRTFIPAAVLAGASASASAGTHTLHNVPSSRGVASLFEARLTETTVLFDAKDESQKQAISLGVDSIKKTFQDIREAWGQQPVSAPNKNTIDWLLWGAVVDNYAQMVEHDPQQLAEAVGLGIPAEIRGMVWQLVARSKNLALEELFMHLKTEPSVHEKAIKRDLTRTSFYTNVEAAHKATELFNVIKAYSLFDPDVGYTQGMVFIVVPLVMNMTESECFSMLVTLMKDYGLRDLFCPAMQGLHLLLYQFDRCLAQSLPLLFNHLTRQDIRLLMYASQWFLTFFSYKFPLDVVLRVFDMVITQGVGAVLRLGLNLVLRNEVHLLSLSFDLLLAYLKNDLFTYYVSDEFVTGDSLRRFPLLKKTVKPTEFYRLDAFIQDSLLVEISALDLKRYKAEFDQLVVSDTKRETEIDLLRDENGAMRKQIKDLETQLYMLNHDHMAAVQSLVETKVLIPEVQNDIEELNDAVATLEAQIADLESKHGASDNIPSDIEQQIQELLAKNASETERFTELDEELKELVAEDQHLRAELKKKKTWFWNKTPLAA